MLGSPGPPNTGIPRVAMCMRNWVDMVFPTAPAVEAAQVLGKLIKYFGADYLYGQRWFLACLLADTD